jgi:hypothetical protein
MNAEKKRVSIMNRDIEKWYTAPSQMSGRKQCGRLPDTRRSTCSSDRHGVHRKRTHQNNGVYNYPFLSSNAVQRPYRFQRSPPSPSHLHSICRYAYLVSCSVSGDHERSTRRYVLLVSVGVFEEGEPPSARANIRGARRLGYMCTLLPGRRRTSHWLG